MDRWRVTLQAWPYSTGRGQEQDQADAGARVQVYQVRGDTIMQAAEAAAEIARAVAASPHVWQAPIKKLERMGEAERLDGSFIGG